MQTLGILWRYACASVSATVKTWQPDFALREAVTDAGEDLTTAFACASTAGTDLVLGEAASKVIVTYWYKAQGPYSYYCNEGEPVAFPPTKPTREIIPLEEQIISAELSPAEEGGAATDVTEAAVRFAGPDGTFHGRGLGAGFDLALLIPSDRQTLTLTYADGHETSHDREQHKVV